MKAQFIVTIEGNWLEGEKRVTKAMMLRDLRQGVREQFEFLAKRTAVSAAAPAPDTSAIRAAALEAAAVLCDEIHYKWRWDNEPDSDSGPRSCASAIRASISGKTGEA